MAILSRKSRWNRLLPGRAAMFFILVLASIHSSEQKGSGAPIESCFDMMPVHSGIQRQSSIAPYDVITSSPLVHQNGLLKVSIVSSIGTPMAGFVLQAREVKDPDIIIGKFTSVPDFNMEKFISCRGDNDSVTHSTPDAKPNLTFTWQAPKDFLGAIFFRATVAQGYTQFWTNITSPLVEVVTPQTVITETSISDPTSVTRRPTLAPTLPPILTSTPRRELDLIYRGCGDTKLCFGSDDVCVSSGSCDAVVAVQVAGEEYTYEMQASKNPAYVAAALSEDAFMGDDSGMECQQVDGKITLFSSWTYPKDEPYVTRNNISQDILQLISVLYSDGKIYCKFTRNVRSTVQNIVFDMERNQYHLMIVSGKTLKPDNRVGFHDLVFRVTKDPVYMSSVGNVGGSSKLFVQLHGAFMLAAWIGAASCGMLIARYFRRMWVGKTLGGKDIWFAWHRILMVLTWLLTMAGFIMVVIDVGTITTTGDNPHAITGMITVILCFLQPIGAYFRPHPGTSKRSIFNWLHWFAGNAAHILGVVTIFFSVYLSKPELPGWTLYILVAYVIFHSLIHLTLSLAMCFDEKQSVHSDRVNSFQMNDMKTNSRPSSRPSSSIAKDVDGPNSKFRKWLLGVYIFIVWLVTIAIICLVFLAPIKQVMTAIENVFSP